MELVLKAREFAEKAHAGVLRKGSSGDPYFYHVERVAAALAAVGLPEAVVAAGYLYMTWSRTAPSSATRTSPPNLARRSLRWSRR